MSSNCNTFVNKNRLGSVTFVNIFFFFVVYVNILKILDTRKLKQEDLVIHGQRIRPDFFAAVEAGIKDTYK